MKTYTIAILTGMVIATVPDGQDVFRAAAEEAERAGIEIDFGDLDVIEGVTLTDEAEEGDQIVFRAGPNTGHLLDEEGRQYSLAVIRVLNAAEMAEILRTHTYEVWVGCLGYDTRPYVGAGPLPVAHTKGYAEAFREEEEVPEWHLEEVLSGLRPGEVVCIPDYWGCNLHGEWAYERTHEGFVALGYRVA